MGELLANLSLGRCLLLLFSLLFMLISVGLVWAGQSSTPLSDCGTLSSGGNYHLTQDVSSDGTCFTIAANNVVLDCQGYTITYSQITGGYGVDINGYNSTTVKNCNIVQGGENYNSYGIFIESSHDNTLTNNSVTTMYNIGIALSSGLENTFTDNTITTTGSGGVANIYMEASSNNTFTNNTMTGTNSFGVYIAESSVNNTLSNNTISTTGEFVSGIFLEASSDSNTFASNTIAGEYCLYITYSSAGNRFYNNFLNCTAPVGFNSAGANYWNTTLTEETNIVGGPWIGGNFYAKPDGNGYSQTCTDDNLDFICESYYGEGDNMDYLPLAQPKPMGSITGTVFNPSGDPVTGADVQAEGTSISTTTNASGEYTLTLLVGVYNVTVSKYQIYLSSSIYGVGVNEDEDTPAPLVSLQYNYAMGCGGSAAIAGHILNSTDGAISGATVYVYPQISGGGMQGGEGGKGIIGGDISNCYGSASSDDNGLYLVFGLKAGIYTISVSPPSDSDYGSKDASDIIISGENETVSYNATLSLGGRIFGKIINAGGSGLPNLDISAYTMSGEGYGWAQTMSGCAAVSNCSVWNNYLDGYCLMAGCVTMPTMCDGTPNMSCGDIPTICSGNVNCDLISEEPSCQNGCDWNTTAHCQGDPNSCGGKPNAQDCAAVPGCEWHDTWCYGELGCDTILEQGVCEGASGCLWNPVNCLGDPDPCSTYLHEDCINFGCTWDAADCQGFPDCSPISKEDCSGISGCNLMNDNCMQVNGCQLNNYCMGTPTASCGDYDEMSCMGYGCWWNSGFCSGSPPSCDSLGVENCISASGCEWSGTDCTGSPNYFCDMGEGMCPAYPGCTWTPGYCGGEMFSCESYYDDVSCAGVGCSWIPVCETYSGLDCFGQTTKEQCDIVTGCTYAPYCIGTPEACGKANDSTCPLVAGCSWNSEEGCFGTPDPCNGQSPCDSPGCYWNSDPCQGMPGNGWQCDQSNQEQCEMSACAWNASNVGRFTIKGLMLGTYSIQVQPQYWLQPPSEYASKMFTDNATIAEEGDLVDVGNLTLGTAGVIKGCVTDALGNPVVYAYLNAYGDAGSGWAQTENAGCSGTVYSCEDSSTNETCLGVGCASWSDTATEAGEYCYDTCQDVIEQGVCEGYNCTWDGSCYNDTASSATDKADCEGTGVGVWKGCTGTPHPCEYWDYDANNCPNSFGCTWGTKACYRITGLATGTYLVEAYSPWYLSLPRTSVGNVAVTEGNETELNISFGASSTIYGYINNSEGDGVPDVYFNVLTEGAGPYSPSEDWGWGMAQTVGCVGTPLSCSSFDEDSNACYNAKCVWSYSEEEGEYCADSSYVNSSCNALNIDDCAYDAGCSWDTRAFYNISGLKGSDTRKYVVIAMPGYYNWYHNASYSQKVNSSVTLPVGGSVEVNFTMTTGGSISGRVVDGSGNPINAGIGAYMPYSEGQLGYGISGWARTANGSYNITGLPAGTYEVQAYPWSGGFTSGHATVTVAEGEDHNLDFTLTAGGKISGRIIENGSAISNAIIEVWSSDASFFAYGAAGVGSDGTFIISGLDPADDYGATIRKISAYGGQESPTYISGISVVADQTTELGDITLIPTNGGIYGNATYTDGSAIPNADVYAWSKDTMAFGWAQTNGSGYYSITGLPPGTYDTMLNLWSFGLSNQFASVEVDTNPVLHNFGLATSKSIYGYVTGGGPISGAEVNIWNSDTSVGMSDTTDANGLYNITIDSGTYSMSVHKEGFFDYFNDSVELSSDLQMDVGMVNVSTTTTYILTGRVTSNGTAQSGATVIAYGGTDDVKSAITNTTGYYTMNNLINTLYNMTVVAGSTTYNSSNVNVTLGSYNFEIG